MLSGNPADRKRAREGRAIPELHAVAAFQSAARRGGSRASRTPPNEVVSSIDPRAMTSPRPLAPPPMARSSSAMGRTLAFGWPRHQPLTDSSSPSPKGSGSRCIGVTKAIASHAQFARSHRSTGFGAGLRVPRRLLQWRELATRGLREFFWSWRDRQCGYARGRF